MQSHILNGRITRLSIYRLVEFGTRASFTIEGWDGSIVVCAVEGDVARQVIARNREGDIVMVGGVYEPRPFTAAADTPWAGRFRVRALHVAETVRLAA